MCDYCQGGVGHPGKVNEFDGYATASRSTSSKLNCTGAPCSNLADLAQTKNLNAMLHESTILNGLFYPRFQAVKCILTLLKNG